MLHVEEVGMFSDENSSKEFGKSVAQFLKDCNEGIQLSIVFLQKALDWRSSSADRCMQIVQVRVQSSLFRLDIQLVVYDSISNRL